METLNQKLEEIKLNLTCMTPDLRAVRSTLANRKMLATLIKNFSKNLCVNKQNT